MISGLGDAWGAIPPPRESTIRELGSHLLQVCVFSPKNGLL